MSKTITILTGSMRPNSISEALLPAVRQELEAVGASVQVADVKQMQLPFVDSLVSPASEAFEITNDRVRSWQQMIQDSDALVMLVPEYNGQPSAVQKNAIDWLYEDWKDKPVAMVSYGWGGGQGAADLMNKLMVKVGASPVDANAMLFFTKDISLEGELLDEAAVRTQLEVVAKTIAE